MITAAQVPRCRSARSSRTRVGKGRFWVIDVEYSNQRGELCAIESFTGFGYRRDTRDHHHRTQAAPRRREGRRRAARRSSYEVTATTVVLGAIAARDCRPMHHDYDFAVNRNGVKNIFLNTPNQAAWYERYVTDWTGPHGRLGAADVPHAPPGVPRRHDGDRGHGHRASAPTTPAAASSSSTSPSTSATPTTPTATSASRSTVSGRQPVAAPRRRLEALAKDLMDLDFTPEQDLLRETVARRVPALLRPQGRARDGGRPASASPTSCGRSSPSSASSASRSPRSTAAPACRCSTRSIVYTEFGRALAPSPHFVSSVMSGGVLARRRLRRAEVGVAHARSRRARRSSRPRGSSPAGGFGPKGVALAATADGDGWKLNGVKRHVYFASAADRLLVLARTADGPTFVPRRPDREGRRARAAEVDRSDTQYEVDVRRRARRRRRRSSAPPATRGPTWDTVMHDGIILLAAQAAGGARYALDITVQYSKDRQQFDKPLGAFQALAHYMADAVTTVDGAETLVLEAGVGAQRRPLRAARSRRWRSCSPARPSATSPRWRSRSSAASASRWSTTSSSTSAGPSSSRSRGGTRRYLEELIAADVLDDREVVPTLVSGQPVK